MGEEVLYNLFFTELLLWNVQFWYWKADSALWFCRATDIYLANTKHLYNICTMLVQHLRRWANVVQMLCKCFVFAGISPQYFSQKWRLQWSLSVFTDYYVLNCDIKWNESGFRPPLCTYRLNLARRTSWGWWDDWDDTVLQTQDSKFEPWRSEAEHATSRSRRLPTILSFTRRWGRNIFVSFKPPRPGTESRTLAWKAAVLITTLGPLPLQSNRHVPSIQKTFL